MAFPQPSHYAIAGAISSQVLCSCHPSKPYPGSLLPSHFHSHGVAHATTQPSSMLSSSLRLRDSRILLLWRSPGGPSRRPGGPCWEGRQPVARWSVPPAALAAANSTSSSSSALRLRDTRPLLPAGAPLCDCGSSGCSCSRGAPPACSAAPCRAHPLSSTPGPPSSAAQ